MDKHKYNYIPWKIEQVSHYGFWGSIAQITTERLQDLLKEVIIVLHKSHKIYIK